MIGAEPQVEVAARPIQIRTPESGSVTLRQLGSYGPVIRALAVRDLKARYKQSLLGPLWTVFQPLALLVCFVVGFRAVAHVKTGHVSYLLYALSGLALWSFFQNVLMSSSGSLINNWTLVRWTACPRLALPLATVVSNLPSLVVPAVAAVGVAAASGYIWIGWLLLPVMLAWLLLLAAAVGVLLAVLSVRARDVISALPFLLQIALFLSPVAYSIANLSPAVRTIVALNPLTGLLEAWRWALLGQAPQAEPVIIAVVLTALATGFAWWLFLAMNGRIADEI